MEASPQYAVDERAFRNPTGIGPGIQGSSLPIIGEYFFGGSRERSPKGALPIEHPHETWLKAPDTGFRTTWLGHSTVLVELDGHRVLTDPVFGERASPFGFAGPRRFHPAPVTVAELPRLDAVVLSHNHYDHLCQRTMLELAKLDVPIVTALGVGALLERLGVLPNRIIELDWGESVNVRGLTFTATPAQHFSGRGMFDRNKSLWAAFVIQSERRKVFFSGDTGLTPQFAETGRVYGPFDLVMLEVGAFHPSWGGIHLGPEKALEAFAMLGGGTLLPVHWGTFNLAMHAWNEPAETLVTLGATLARTSPAGRANRIVTPRLGAAVDPERLPGPTPWWREALTEPGERTRVALGGA